MRNMFKESNYEDLAIDCTIRINNWYLCIQEGKEISKNNSSAFKLKWNIKRSSKSLNMDFNVWNMAKHS